MVVSGKPRSLWRGLKLWVKVMVPAVVILLVLGAGYRIHNILTTCGPDVSRVDGQCVGVTDGSVELSPDLADVLGKIRQENERIDRSGRPVVSVAYLLALPKPTTNDALAVTLRHELEGAYLAQRRANRTEGGLGDEPLLRLLVANDGDDSSQWQEVVPALMDRVEGPERLVAVVATGQTVAHRQAAIGALTANGIPVIASRLTGDSLTPQPDDSVPVQGLVRLTPSNSDQAVAAAAFLKRTQATARALLVQNTDPTDTYSRSLGDAFRRAFPDSTHAVLEPIEPYNPQLGGVANTMKGMLPNICQQRPDVIFFAGRSAELAAFIAALPSRPCPDLPINIMTGSDAVDFANAVAQDNRELLKGLSSNVSVRYTALAHPESWKASPESFAQGSTDYFQSACSTCFSTLFSREFPGKPLADGAAIIGHDAIVTAVTAIRPREGINDRPNLVTQQFNRMHGRNIVPGAGGWISLDDSGNPRNRAVPILAVRPDGAVAFVQLSSPRGVPCRPEDPALC